MVHVRRKFVEVFEREGSAIAGEAIKRTAALYTMEKTTRGKTAEERVVLRQAQAGPVFDDLKTWLQQQVPKISGKSKLSEAIRYTLSRTPRARGYLSDGRLELGNNICENSTPPIAKPDSFCTSCVSI